MSNKIVINLVSKCVKVDFSLDFTVCAYTSANSAKWLGRGFSLKNGVLRQCLCHYRQIHQIFDIISAIGYSASKAHISMAEMTVKEKNFYFHGKTPAFFNQILQ